MFKPWMGRKKIFKRIILTPLPGLCLLCDLNPRLARWATFGRCSAASNGFDCLKIFVPFVFFVVMIFQCNR
jgi:hypothetical protein